MMVQGKNEIDLLLVKSLKELAAKKPIEKITIKEITDKAGVIRPTFYNHFQDKYELIEWIITNELLEQMRPLIHAGMTNEAMILMLTNMSLDKSFYKRVQKMEGVITFHEIAMKCVKQMLIEIIKERTEGKTSRHPWITPEIIAEYYAQSMCFVTEKWIEEDMIIPPREMAEAYIYIISRSMDDILKEM